MPTIRSLSILLLFFSLLPIGCGSSDSARIVTNVKLSNDVESSSRLDIGGSSLVAGQNTAASLASLKYYIRGISICEGLTTSGTAFNDPTGCIEIYSGPENSDLDYDPAQDYTNLADAARGITDGYIDLMDAESRASVTSTISLTADDVRSYNWGIVTWYPPIKVTASVPMNSGGTFFTKDGTTAKDTNGYFTTAAGSFTDGPSAEEALILHTNGGTWFRFQNPFVVSQEDIDSQTSFALDLTFNPDGLIKGFTSQTASGFLEDGSGNSIAIPFLDLTPIAHKASDRVIKETYVAALPKFDIRFEFYYIDSDPEKTIYGVDVKTLVNAGSDEAFYDFPKVSFIGTAGDGSLELEDWSTYAVVTGFQRQDEVNETTSAQINCKDAAFTFTGCADGATSNVTFTLTKIETLQ